MKVGTAHAFPTLRSYIQEEVEEIEGLSKQVVWAVRPILRENNKNPTMVANLL